MVDERLDAPFRVGARNLGQSMLRQTAWIGAIAISTAVAAAADLPNSPTSPATPQIAGSPVSSELSRAAACIERGEVSSAIDILASHLQAHPDQITVRAYLAELLWRLERLSESRAEFARFIADAQVAGIEPGRLIHAHARSMAIAEKSGDRAGEHLHRGIGLFWLAQREANRAKAESLCCRAAGELALAERARPDDARLKWYLHLVWTALEQTARARTCLAAAEGQADFSDLTDAERADLALTRAADRACRAQFP